MMHPTDTQISAGITAFSSAPAYIYAVVTGDSGGWAVAVALPILLFTISQAINIYFKLRAEKREEEKKK